jgi:hypothetical protein
MDSLPKGYPPLETSLRLAEESGEGPGSDRKVPGSIRGPKDLASLRPKEDPGPADQTESLKRPYLAGIGSAAERQGPSGPLPGADSLAPGHGRRVVTLETAGQLERRAGARRARRLPRPPSRGRSSFHRVGQPLAAASPRSGSQAFPLRPDWIRLGWTSAVAAGRHPPASGVGRYADLESPSFVEDVSSRLTGTCPGISQWQVGRNEANEHEWRGSGGGAGHKMRFPRGLGVVGYVPAGLSSNAGADRVPLG